MEIRRLNTTNKFEKDIELAIGILSLVIKAFF